MTADYEKLKSIGELMDRNIVLKGADLLTEKGFTQVPNHVLSGSVLSPGAKLTYAMLLKFAWQNDYCFPGQERLAREMGVWRDNQDERGATIKMRRSGRMVNDCRWPRVLQAD
ncbi:MAG: helix-turn-helix domain-containing protein [Sphingomonas sp.]